MSIVEVQELRKQYDPPKGVLAVDGVSFDIDKGEIFSLLGPNGAGKSTTISMLSCLLHPSGGDAFVDGHSVVSDSQAVKEAIGVVPQDIALYPDMSARENLVFWGKMYGLAGAELHARVDEVLELITLVDRQKDRVEKFSGGMKRRVNIGVALLHKPKVLYLDEPTVGIDPQSRRSILDGILALRDQGMTILYTTHYMAEAQELSDRIGIVDHGKMIAVGTNEELVKIVGEEAHVELQRRPRPRGDGGALGARSTASTGRRSTRTTPCCWCRTPTRCCRGSSRRPPRPARASPRSTSPSPTSRWCSCTSPARASEGECRRAGP